jgi:LmbE family N-acetylglucosaminyl deacetylase
MATVVAFHAHPDDEALLTGGTLARLAADGHRVVIVVATDGVVQAAPAPGAPSRLDELRASAEMLGAARVEHLGYATAGTARSCSLTRPAGSGSSALTLTRPPRSSPPCSPRSALTC